jgi:diguanylate cyclase (GGDEF)-like protein/PAS domain S-box-containing protein
MIKTSSLGFRLWVTVAIAVLPFLLFALLDYQDRREEAVARIHTDITQQMSHVQREMDSAHRLVELVLKIMAGSNDFQGQDPVRCAGIARRLLNVLPGFANIGAATAGGAVFCSAQPAAAQVDVADRSWFQAGLQADGLTPGEFIRGRISGKPGLVFGYPIKTPTGEVKAVLFASITLDWFEAFFRGFGLSADWEASVIGTDGHVLLHHPDSTRWRGEAVPADFMDRLARVAAVGDGIEQFAGLDGALRLYGVAQPESAAESGFVLIGAPFDRSLDAVNARFQTYVGVIVALALVSLLLARFYVYRLVEVWAQRVRAAVARIAGGDRDARVGFDTGVGELDELSYGIDRMTVEIEKRESELRRLSTVIEQSPESIVITDTDARILYVNEAFKRITGYALDEVVGRNPRVLNNGLTPRATYVEMWAALSRGEVWRGEFHNTRKDGSNYLELATVAPIKDAAGAVTHYVAVKEDITQRKQSEALLHRLAYFDALTELPNRALLHDRVAQAIRSSVRKDSYGMLMLIDIDRFRQLNDSLGHAAGDRLLCAVAERLRKLMREEDTIARHGDDDFAVLIEHIGDTEDEAIAHAEHVARKVQRGLDAPYSLGVGEDERHFVTLSIGISLFHDGESSLDTLLKQAEVALYRAKRDGRNTVCFFNPEMQAVVDAHARMEARIHEALEAEAFRVFYQPQFDRRGRVTGAEALVRWPQADGSMVSPAEFIPLAEDTGQIVRLGLWVLRTACAQLVAWQADERTRGLTIAVNVSARQFHQPDFVASVTRTVSAAGIDPGRLKLELTESAILSDLNETVIRMNQLRAIGIQFALDDFGTGYSSLSYLKRLPFAQLKIDQSFIRDMARDEGSEAIVLAVLSMSHALGLEVVAEGVETPAQRDFLRQHGCEFYQGYLFGKPVPIEAWGDFLAMR